MSAPLWKCCKRRHLKRRLKWVKNKYFRRIKGADWTFCCDVKDRRGNKIPLCLYNIHRTPIIRHVKVRGTASPFDGDLTGYWEKRRIKEGKSQWVKGSKYERVAKQQNWKCPNCKQSLLNGESIETHHIVLVKNGGSDDVPPLIHLHSMCHKQEHSKPKLKAGSMALCGVMGNCHARFLGEGREVTLKPYPIELTNSGVKRLNTRCWSSTSIKIVSPFFSLPRRICLAMGVSSSF